MRFFINPIKAVLCLAAFAAFVFLFLISCQSKKAVPMTLYFILSIVYLGLTLYYTIILEINDVGIRNRFLFWTYNIIPWSGIEEVGIANMKIIKNAERKKAGELYLYFSREAMTEKERFGMCLHWPPREKPYMRFSVKRLKKIQTYREVKPALAWLREETYYDRYFKR